MTPLLFIILSNPISKSTNKNKKVKDLIRSGMRSGPGQMPVQLLNQQSSLLLTRERDFLSLLGSPLKNRSHITVVYESTMSYQLRYTASPPEGQAFSAGTCCWARRDPVIIVSASLIALFLTNGN
jgi:hypothetical protein